MNMFLDLLHVVYFILNTLIALRSRSLYRRTYYLKNYENWLFKGQILTFKNIELLWVQSKRTEAVDIT